MLVLKKVPCIAPMRLFIFDSDENDAPIRFSRDDAVPICHAVN